MSSLHTLSTQNNTSTQEPSQVEGHLEAIQVPFIDLEEDNDDVIESSPRPFHQARANARINGRRTATNLNFGLKESKMNSLHTLSTQNNTPTQEPSQVEGHLEAIQVPFIDLEEDNDDVIESSPTSFYQARANARINRRRTATNLNFGLKESKMSSLHTLSTQNNTPTQEPSQVEGHLEAIQVPFIDLEEDNDDVIESSPTSFYQARANARINRRRTATNLNFGNQTEVPLLPHNGAISTNLESSATVELQHANNLPENNQEVIEPMIEDAEPPKEVSCPICLDSFVEATATKCGHIFCNGCIRASIRTRAKCPTCRKKITSRGLRRVFLPS